jgi:hypothetical protein
MNLVSFSGFFFCFGYASFTSYLSKSEIPKDKMFLNAVRILTAYYISGLSYRYFVSGTLNYYNWLRIIFFLDFPPFSEFLLSFSCVIMISMLCSQLIIKILQNSFLLIITLLVCLLSSIIDFPVMNVPQFGLLIGDGGNLFPIIPYLPLFLMGAFFSYKKIEFSRIYLIISIISIAQFILFLKLTGKIPSRFPPSASWIIASFGSVYIYYLLSIYLDKNRLISNILGKIGSNVLYWLLLSNVIIFVFSLMIPRGSLSITDIAILYGVVLSLIYYLHAIQRTTAKKI